MSSETDHRIMILSTNDFLSRLEPFVPRFGGPIRPALNGRLPIRNFGEKA